MLHESTSRNSGAEERRVDLYARVVLAPLARLLREGRAWLRAPQNVPLPVRIPVGHRGTAPHAALRRLHR